MEKIITTIDGTYVIEKGVLTGFGQLEGMKGSQVLVSKVVVDPYLRDSILTPGVKEIGEYAFNYCGLTSVVIPDSCEYLGYYSFANCGDLQQVVIGSGMKFSWCGELERVELPSTLEHIASDAFSHCFSLKEICVFGDNPRYFSIGGVLYERTKDGEKVVIDPKDCRD